VSMMVDLKVMAYFKISLSTRNWDRAFLLPSDCSCQTRHERAPSPSIGQVKITEALPDGHARHVCPPTNGIHNSHLPVIWLTSRGHFQVIEFFTYFSYG
ncbi:hypothetical protein ACK33Z_03835, partial [Aeromonas veronii]